MTYWDSLGLYVPATTPPPRPRRARRKRLPTSTTLGKRLQSELNYSGARAQGRTIIGTKGRDWGSDD